MVIKDCVPSHLAQSLSASSVERWKALSSMHAGLCDASAFSPVLASIQTSSDQVIKTLYGWPLYPFSRCYCT